MTRRYVSTPLLNILEAGGLTPLKIYESISQQVSRNCYPVLRSNHPDVQLVRTATGLHVIGIDWRYGRLLVSIEQIVAGRIGWFYDEMKSTHCSFRYPAEVPATVVETLKGKPLSTVTNEIAPLLNVKIAGEDQEYAKPGWLCLKLTPAWVPF